MVVKLQGIQKTVLDPSQCLHTLLLSAHLYLAKLDNEMHIRDI